MPIEMHCPACRKLIRAPDEAAGKQGKCPYCGVAAYIPLPAADEEIPLAPIDTEEEQRQRQLEEEARNLANSIRHDKEGLEASRRAGRSTPAAPAGEVVDIPTEVRRYVIAMRDSKLDQAERIVARLKREHNRAQDYVQGLLVDSMPPTVENIPPAVMNGFLKRLSHELA